jgi:soluble lytic murein transglycosylase-like protein
LALPPNIAQLAESIGQRFGLPPGLLAALVLHESGGNPRAVSPVGAQGLTQLMPSTAKNLGVTDPFNAVQNLTGGAKYLASQLAHFKSVPLALAAYNAGPGAVSKYGGIPPYAETQAYVRNVMASAGQGGGGAGAVPAGAMGGPNVASSQARPARV